MKHVFHRVWRLGECAIRLIGHPRCDSTHHIFEKTALICAVQRQGVAGVFRKIAGELGTESHPFPEMEGF